MAEWLVEQGIGEERAVRLEGSTIVAARLHWPGGLVAGQVEDARLTIRHAGTPRGIGLFSNGERAHVDKLPHNASEGATMRLAVTRSRGWEAGRRKLAQCRPSDLPLREAPGLAEQLEDEGESVRAVRRFPPEVEWDELWSEADGQCVAFASGSLLPSPPPAMLLIDIDGEDAPDRLAASAVQPLARMFARMDIGGNIGIDFPTLAEKAHRKRIDAALADALADWPHERTAMNGFGFVQIVARLRRPSLLGLIVQDPAGAIARRLLRQAEHLDGPGITELHCTEWVAPTIQAHWMTELEKRTGASSTAHALMRKPTGPRSYRNEHQ